MTLLLIVASAATAAAANTPNERVRPRARATVRIERPARVSEDSWKAHSLSRRREIQTTEAGRPIVIRIIDFE